MSSNIVTEAELQPGSMVETKYWHRVEGDRVQCDLCPRDCKLKEGQRGLCFVRANIGGKIVLTSYGRSSGYCVDPIEKKPLNHFLPGTPVLSFGTAGCNLACKFCQNWDISKSREIDTLADAASPEVIAHAAEELGCRSVAYTYNDPVIFHEYAIDVARACREKGIKSVAVTAGYVCEEPRREFYQWDTLLYLKHETDVWVELTTLLIPGWNDSDEEIEAMTKWVVKELGPEVPMHFTAFHPDYKMMDVPPTPQATLTLAREIALKNGVHYAYTGNVHDKAGESTYCHCCGQRLIGRDWYVLSEWNLDAHANCNKCGTHCAGVFEEHPGDWGAKRLPVRLADFSA
jgi:pyruvate formate lyase activating enzyme